MAVTISTAVIFSAIAAVSATHSELKTPLYTVRMEQAGNRMNFLPKEMSNFTYIAKGEYVLTCTLREFCDTEPSGLTEFTCDQACPTEYDTCDGDTCEGTCWGTTCEGYTCEGCPTRGGDTCWETCVSCYPCAPSSGPTYCYVTCYGC